MTDKLAHSRGLSPPYRSPRGPQDWREMTVWDSEQPRTSQGQMRYRLWVCGRGQHREKRAEETFQGRKQQQVHGGCVARICVARELVVLVAVAGGVWLRGMWPVVALWQR